MPCMVPVCFDTDAAVEQMASRTGAADCAPLQECTFQAQRHKRSSCAS